LAVLSRGLLLLLVAAVPVPSAVGAPFLRLRLLSVLLGRLVLLLLLCGRG